ncbi:hypothetical protein Godav_025725 [Gossypium davidsonii]|uniref:Uncharacterized protein n=2 Tax=Gossypium TaxID=3633 RepID=A0A7J8TA88_GOSDV|nr:hypothetical protein [Gossypium davidsonii]MBA0665046.1 hypothetical protein [Gossypium klotzschianum]
MNSSPMEPFPISSMIKMKSTRGRGIYDYALLRKLRVRFLTCTHLHPSPFITEISSLVTYY